MEDKNILIGQEVHCWFHDWIWSTSHEGKNKQHICNLFIKEECPDGYYQNYIGIPTNDSTRNTQRVKGGNYFNKAPINIGKSKDNFDKDRKPRYFNYNIYRHIIKECQKPRKCYKCDKIGHLAKYCRSEQKMKIKSTQEESNNNNEESLSFVEGLK